MKTALLRHAELCVNHLWPAFRQLLDTPIRALAPAGTGQAELVERLLDLDLECSLADVNGWTPLTYASAGGHASCVGLLLAAGASVGEPDVHGRTPLHWAAERGWVDVLTLLAPAMMLEGQDLGLQVGRRKSAVGRMLTAFADAI